ncbi:hypothetical protein, partial [Salmonella sp. SAL4457]|uniref:hypothetical protein n=1 Tax=Salmonella sp. SAL4457 TaxID=3159912 RepID=UPI0039796ABC
AEVLEAFGRFFSNLLAYEIVNLEAALEKFRKIVAGYARRGSCRARAAHSDEHRHPVTASEVSGPLAFGSRQPTLRALGS